MARSFCLSFSVRGLIINHICPFTPIPCGTCIVINLFSGKIIGWHRASRHNVDLTLTAFRKAYAQRKAPNGLIFHSDQVSKSTAFAFGHLMDSLNVVQSFSKKGYPYDNACCESFFKYLEKNRTNRSGSCIVLLRYLSWMFFCQFSFFFIPSFLNFFKKFFTLFRKCATHIADFIHLALSPCYID